MKVLRKIDRRNALYGTYKYQVKAGSIPGGALAPRQWCREKWGEPRLWVEQPIESGEFRCWYERNPRWTEVRRTSRSAPLIYIRDEADAVMFSLFWSGQ